MPSSYLSGNASDHNILPTLAKAGLSRRW